MSAKSLHPSTRTGSALALAAAERAFWPLDDATVDTALTALDHAPHVALLDRDGVVIGVNGAWRRFAIANGGPATAGRGRNYLHICEYAAKDDEPGAHEAGLVVEAALDGSPAPGTATYPCPDRTGKPRYFRMYATSLPGRHRGVLVVHIDVTTSALHPRGA